MGEERREGRERKGTVKESCHETYIYTSIYNTPRGGGGCSWDGDRGMGDTLFNLLMSHYKK